MLKKYRSHLFTLVTIALMMVTIQCINTITHYSLNQFGLSPRTLHGLLGILTSPWLHSSWNHLFSNLPVLLLLSILVMIQSLHTYYRCSVIILLVSGLLTWLFSRNAIHIGASNWIFGLWALLLVNGFLRAKILDVVFSLLILFYFSSMILGLLPLQFNISFEGHIAGALSGGYCAWLINRYPNYLL